MAFDCTIAAACEIGGCRRSTELRDVMDGLLYTAASGCARSTLLKDFPPVTTVQGYFYTRRDSGL